MKEEKHFHSITSDESLNILNTNISGLSNNDAEIDLGNMVKTPFPKEAEQNL
ncbi:MAG: hypothetical protein HC906_07050 [Bacteroidales bacterium]|nr:hypothetical protein [Bacteroidales bacterium]